MTLYWKIINNVIERSDVLLEVLDSRLPELTRNREIEEKIQKSGKKLILVLNKCDLISKEIAEQNKKQLSKEYPVVFISTKEHHGTKLLREAILRAANKKEVVVGVLGYPNTGKSSVINVLKGRKAAPTSPIAGYTRAIQKIRITNRIIMLDTPGVLPFLEKDDIKHVLIGAKMFSDVENPDIYASEIIKLCNSIDEKIIPKFYGIEQCNDEYELLEKIAEKRHMLRKGGLLDIDRASRLVIQDWQVGRISLCTN